MLRHLEERDRALREQQVERKHALELAGAEQARLREIKMQTLRSRSEATFVTRQEKLVEKIEVHDKTLEEIQKEKAKALAPTPRTSWRRRWRLPRPAASRCHKISNCTASSFLANVNLVSRLHEDRAG